MDDRLPECVIASSNRYNDIEPYCTLIYHEEPRVWDSIFPWEFPQNGTKDEEEHFLRRFFPETEIYMQGFRFLKQVWYSIALFNLNYRVPEFTKWWLAKPSSIELVNDPNLQPFLLKPDAKPSTFFSDELPQYGEDFLSVVVPYLQQSVKNLLEKREVKEGSQCAEGDAIVTQHATKKPCDDAGLTSAQSVDSEGHIVHTTVSLPTPTNVQHPSTAKVPKSAYTGMPQSALPYKTPTELAIPSIAGIQQQHNQISQFHPRVADNEQPFQQYHPLPSRAVSNEQPFQQETKFQSRKRGNNDARRFNSRAGSNFQPRPPHPFNERNASMYPSPGYGPSPVPMHSHPRMPSGGYMEFMPSLPQGQALPTMSPHGQFIPGQFGPPGPMQQGPVPPEAQIAHGHPQHYFNNPFGDRSNAQFIDPAFTGQPHVTYFPNQDNFSEGHRRNDHGSRGGKARGSTFRGNSGNRGKTTRGRNSFSSQDQPPFIRQGDNPDPQPFGHSFGDVHPFKHRRGSVFHESNWRSGSDNPQTQHSERVMKENMLPNRPPGIQTNPPPSFVPHNQLSNNMDQRAKSGFETSQATHMPVHHPFRTTSRDPAQFPIDPRTLKFEQTCGDTWIGKDCSFVDKLLVFDVPTAWSMEMVEHFFSQFGEVRSAKRSHVPTKYGTGGPSLMVWVQYANAAGARNCMALKPERWFEDRPLHVEVPRQFWDPTHAKYIFGPPGGSIRPPEESKTATPVPSILRRVVGSTPTTRAASVERPVVEETESTDTTPTPSGASSPKTKKNKKAKSKKEKADLRKASFNPKGEHKGQEADASSHPDSGSTTMSSEGDPGAKNGAVIEKADLVTLDIAAIQKERSGSEQTEVQTVSEPAFSPIDVVETHLPAPAQAVQQDLPGTLRPGSAQAEIQTTSDLAFTPTDTESIHVSEPLQPFREEKATASQETATDRVDEVSENTAADATAALAKTNVTPPKRGHDPSDDSFHTAIGSSDGTKCDSGDKESVISEPETIIAVTDKADDTSTTEKASDEVSGELDATIPASPDSAVSPKTIKRAHVPQLPAKARVASDSFGSASRPQLLQSPLQSASAVSPALPTPAYYTAPNTPAVVQESPKESPKESLKKETKEESKDEAKEKAKEEVKETTPVAEPPKQAEKPKGPAQTESFSLFGKKKEKKPKAGKKGTLKGKPRANSNATSDIASGSVSRAPSGAATPNIDHPAQGDPTPINKKSGGEDMARADSKQPDKPAKAPTSQDTEKDVAEDVVAPSIAQQETPSKRKGVRGLLSLLTGGQTFLSTSSSSSSKADPAPPLPPSDRDPLTGKKAPDRPLETEIRMPADAGPDDEADTSRGEEGMAMVDVGLGISTAGGEASFNGTLVAKSRPKKKIRKAKKKQRQPAESSSDAHHSSTPVSDWSTVPGRLGFGEDSFSGFGFGGGGDGGGGQKKVETNEPAHLPAATAPMILPASQPARDDLGDETETEVDAEASGVVEDSQSSSRTASLSGADVLFTPAILSPAPSTPSKKLQLLSNPPGSGHLVQARTPKWKQKRRVLVDVARKSETPPDTEDEDEEEEEEPEEEEEEGDGEGERSIWVISSRPKREPEELSSGPKRQEKLYLYVGEGVRADGDDEEEEGEVEKSREKLQELAREELRRRRRAEIEPASTSTSSD